MWPCRLQMATARLWRTQVGQMWYFYVIFLREGQRLANMWYFYAIFLCDFFMWYYYVKDTCWLTFDIYMWYFYVIFLCEEHMLANVIFLCEGQRLANMWYLYEIAVQVQWQAVCEGACKSFSLVSLTRLEMWFWAFFFFFCLVLGC